MCAVPNVAFCCSYLISRFTCIIIIIINITIVTITVCYLSSCCLCYMPERNHVSRVHSVAAILWLYL